MEAGLQSLLLCGDDKVVRVLRRVLSEMEIAVEHCSDPDSATRLLTRQRFEAVIVDCTVPEIAGKVLSGTRNAPANRRAITVAILEAASAGDSQAALKRAFAMGSHFVLFKPISIERTRASFRAVRALMKRERIAMPAFPSRFQSTLKSTTSHRFAPTRWILAKTAWLSTRAGAGCRRHSR